MTTGRYSGGVVPVPSQPLVPEVLTDRAPVHSPGAGEPVPEWLSLREKVAISLVALVIFLAVAFAAVVALTGWPFATHVSDARATEVTGIPHLETPATSEGPAATLPPPVFHVSSRTTLPVDAELPGELISISQQAFAGTTDLADAFPAALQTEIAALEADTSVTRHEYYTTQDREGRRFVIELIQVQVLTSLGEDVAEFFIDTVLTVPSGDTLGGQEAQSETVETEDGLARTYVVPHNDAVYLVFFQTAAGNDAELQAIIDSFMFLDTGIGGGS